MKINMKTEEIQFIKKENLILDPVALFTEELKNKTFKKQAVQEISTIALALTPKRIREELVPLIIKTFLQENTQIRIAILRSFCKLLQFIKEKNNAFVILQFVIDVLCTFGEQEMRRQAYLVLQQLMKFIDLKGAQVEIRRVVEQLSKESDKNIRQLNLKLIRYLFGVNNPENQKQLQGLLNSYRQNQQNQLILVMQLEQLMKIVPPFPMVQIHSIIQQMIETGSAKVKTKLIDPILLLTKIQSSKTTNNYILTLLKDTNQEVVSSLIMRIKNIKSLFPVETTNQLLKIIDDFQTKDYTIKTAILEMLEDIPLTEERRKVIINSHNPNKSLNLSKLLAHSLCKVHDIQALSQIIDQSDTEFKNKLFPKLPSTCEIHIRLMDNLLTQKNWRSKLTLLQNIQKRLQNGENVQILIPKLLQQMGDKIAVVRMGVAKLIALIIRRKKIHLQEINKQLSVILQSKNWFERQSVVIMLEELCAQNYRTLSKSDHQFIKFVVKKGLTDTIQNIRFIAQSINQKCGLKLQ